LVDLCDYVDLVLFFEFTFVGKKLIRVCDQLVILNKVKQIHEIGLCQILILIFQYFKELFIFHKLSHSFHFLFFYLWINVNLFVIPQINMQDIMKLKINWRWFGFIIIILRYHCILIFKLLSFIVEHFNAFKGILASKNISSF